MNSPTYAVGLKQIDRELNIRYVLEGSVQRGDNRLRDPTQRPDPATTAAALALAVVQDDADAEPGKRGNQRDTLAQ